MQKIGFLLLIAYFCSYSAHSQSLSDTLKLQAVNVSAKKILKNLYKQRSFDSLVLSNYQNTNLATVLAEQSSVYIKTYGVGALATSSFRGTNASHTQVSWNGINLNSPTLGQLDFSLLPTVFVDKMELSFGAAALETQDGALGGSIDLKNKANWHKIFKINLLQTFGSFQTYSSAAKISYGTGRFFSNTRLLWQQAKNNYPYLNKVLLQNPFWEKRKQADYQQDGLMQELYFRPNERHIFSVMVWAQNFWRNIPQPIVITGVQRHEEQFQSFFRTRAAWKYYPNVHNSWKSSFAFLHENMSYLLDFQNNSTNNINSKNKINSLFANLVFERRVQAFSCKVGYRFRSDLAKSSFFSEEKLKLSHVFYEQFSYLFGERLQLSELVKLQLNKDFNAYLTTSLGANYALIPDKFHLKFSLLRNLHEPSMNDLYWQPGGNENLENEFGITKELGFVFHLERHNFLINSDLSFYYSRINNWILWQPSQYYYWTAQNLRQVKTSGVDWNLRITATFFQANLLFTENLNYGYTTNLLALNELDNSIGKQLIYTPPLQNNMGLQLIFRNWRILLSHHRLGKRYTRSDNKDFLPSYQLVNLAVSCKLLRKKSIWSFQFKVENMLNTYYESIAYYPMPLRYFHLSLNWSLNFKKVN